MSDEAFPLGATLKNPVTIEHMPDWASPSDVVVRRGTRWFIVSLHESEPRWRKLLRWWAKMVDRKSPEA